MIYSIAYLFDPGHGPIDSGMVCCLRSLIAESIQGAKKEKEISSLKNLGDTLPLLPGWHRVIPVGESWQEYWVEGLLPVNRYRGNQIYD